MARILFEHTYDEIISVENLLLAWQEFRRGKRSRDDVQKFERQLMPNLFSLHERLATKNYRHDPYEAFVIADPKTRNIHKATVADRVLHRAVYRKLYPFFDRTFIADSFSCRIGKGTHRALNQFRIMAYQVSHNHTKTCWVLKCDVRKFFASIDHARLLAIVERYIPDQDVRWLIGQIIGSFNSGATGVGLPLGNLTSQLFANVYLNELDQFVKHRLKARHYIRYADDFVLLSEDREWLEAQLPTIRQFLYDQLCLTLHPDKISIQTIASGVDFLGWVHFSNHRVLRSASKRRMFRRIDEHPTEPTLQSYLGLLTHGNTQHIRQDVLQRAGLFRNRD